MIDVTIYDTNFAHEITNSMTYGIKPKHINWCRDKKERSGYTFFTDYSMPRALENNHHKKVAVLMEPPGINHEMYNFVHNHSFLFDYILTTNYHIAESHKHKNLDNILWLCFAGSWLKDEEQKIYDKTKLISLPYSSKQMLEGHRLRHLISEKFADKYSIELYKSEQKYQTLDPYPPYKFSIVCENDRMWFTEKLIHCFNCGTIPIYWGLPEIGKFFNEMGILSFTHLYELEEILEDIKTGIIDYDDYVYEIQENFELAKSYTCPEDWLYKTYPFLFEDKK